MGKLRSLRRSTSIVMTMLLVFVGSVTPLVTVDAAENCPCSIWSDADTPSIESHNDPNAVELGVKFQSNVAGEITGIRFYKGSGNTGTHVGSLWATNGTKLAEVTFTNETGSGWQEALFSTPVAIIADTTYVASYHAPNGGYAADGGYFASSATLNDPLTALQSGPSGGNGVYRYGASGFPSSSFNATNYWVDVVFEGGASSPPPLEQGPDGPILAINSDSNQFSKYYSEILRAEGLNSFASEQLSNVDAALLNQYDVVILGDLALTSAQVTMFTDWVNAGGNLIAMSPDKQLANLLGLNDQSATLSEAYIDVDTSSAPGAGVTSESMQFHGEADLYTTQSGTATVAELYSDPNTATGNPAVSLRSVGGNGGEAAAFTYDLARSIVYTHQGNPAWAGDERDGIAPIRPNDLFFGAKAGDVQPDWINLDKVEIPQADEQQRLLTNLIQHMNQDKKPLPKFWYFPNNEKAVIVMAGDDHGTAVGSEQSFDSLIAASPANCDVDNWECYRSTSWIYINSGLTDTEAAAYAAQGFDIGVHVDTGCANWTPTSLATDYANQLAQFQAQFPSLQPQEGHRVHCIAWSDWATQPQVELNNGIRIDLNYYYWPGSWVQNRPGFFTGSGLPMRFAELDGQMIDVYQVASHLVNESGMIYPDAINTQLERALGPEGYYGAFGTHYDFTDNFDQLLLAAAQTYDVPLVSAQQMLDWTDGRNNSSMTNIDWNNDTLEFEATVDARAGSMLRGMLPVASLNGNLADITHNGSPVTFTTETVKGIEYAIFPVQSGSYAAAYTVDVTPPTVVENTPINGATGVAVSVAPTVTFSEAMDPATVNTNTLELRDSSNNLVVSTVTYNGTANEATITPNATLAPNSTYTVTAQGGSPNPVLTDVAGNPLPADHSWSFTTGDPINDVSIWSDTTLPGNITINDPNAVELGVKFQGDTNGYIKGIRFYKGPSNTGTHVGTLWDVNGNVLASATFTNETGSGWQEVIFSSPVAVTAGTTYVASYHAPNGMYSADNFYFQSGVTNGPLTVLQDGIVGGNGVYQYGGGGFPTSSFRASNYWVDVVFSTTP